MGNLYHFRRGLHEDDPLVKVIHTRFIPMAFIILGVTGSIAAYKAADLCSRLVKSGHDVHCVCTAKACEFITPLTLQTISRNRVFTSFDDEKNEWIPPHISMTDKAALLVVAPATANTIAHMAYGFAHDILGAVYLATQSPILICPAMNTRMWTHPATQHNKRILASRPNHYILGPASEGVLACGARGAGKLVPVDTIVQAIQDILDGHSPTQCI